MSTYAEYYLWAGIARDSDGEWRFEGESSSLLEEVAAGGLGGVERDGLRFVEIDMHGVSVGVGVVIAELSWETAIGKANEFDPSVGDRARDILQRVQAVFAADGIRVVVKLYHHLDLGG